MKTIVFDAKENKSIETCAKLILSGKLVAFPTETVYGLGASAFDKSAVDEIFRVKGRANDNPLIVHADSLEMADTICHLSDRAIKCFEKFSPGPFSGVLFKKDVLPKNITCGLRTVAVRIPNNEFALKLIKKSGVPIVAPSANISGRPSPTRYEHVYHDLCGKIPAILNGGECTVGLESSVCDLTEKHIVLLRPGAVTLEMLREIDKKADVFANKPGEIDIPPSPGMKYTHYAPNIYLTLVLGMDYNTVISKIKHCADKDIENNKVPLIICLFENLTEYSGYKTLVMGTLSDLSSIARNLFNLLREADNLGADTAYIEGLNNPNGIGSAIMNRLHKACSKTVTV